MKKIFTLVTLAAACAAYAQTGDPQLDHWIFSTGGCDYEYYSGPPTGTPLSASLTDAADVMEVCYDADYVYIKTNNIPGTYTAGPWVGNPNVPAAQNYTMRIPRNPDEELGSKTEQPFGGATSVAVNGIVFFGTGDAKSYNSSTNSNESMGDGLWNADAWVSEGPTLDASGNGHADGSSIYHYHANPIALYTDPSSSHSPIVGFALDGYPIYGPFGYSSPMDASSSIARMESGYALRSISDRTVLPDGTTSSPPGPSDFTTFPMGTYKEDYEFTGAGDLDEYNGRECVTPEYPGGTYAYFISTDASTGDPAYPYVIGPEYYGVISAMHTGGGAVSWSVPTGATCMTQHSTSIDENNLVDVSIYPNPTNGLLSIDAGSEIISSVAIFDLSGRQVDLVTNSSQLDVSNLANGIYSVKVHTLNGYATQRIVKN